MSENTAAFEEAPQEANAEQVAQFDYFGFKANQRHILPDGISWIEFKILNEGGKSKFQRETQRDLIIERGSGNARTKIDPASQRHELIKASVVEWNLIMAGRPVAFTPQRLRDFLELSSPSIVEDLEKAIRKANPWLMDEMSVEDIDREIDSLKEMREVAELRESGEGSSASR